MNSVSRCCLVLLSAALALPAALHAQEDNQPPEGFTALFNGSDLSGWYGLGHFDPRTSMKYAQFVPLYRANQAEFKKHWRAESGELVNDGEGPYATTEKEFGDIELWIDYKTVPKADSGIYLRANPQVQIWDYTDQEKWKLGADKGSGGLWNNSAGRPGKDPLVLADKPLGEWNRFRILQIGDRTSVWLNGKLVVDRAVMENFWDRSRPLFARGPIQLQTHGGEIRWRNIFIREIPPEDANAYLREKDAEGFVPLLAGNDFEGWAGPVESYEIKDGVLVCKPGKGGTIYTKEEYGDFVVRLEFKLPEGGNNGLAIRYPGEGEPAYTGMCELQILDTEHPKYAGLDARQAHGSAYGMVPAHRGYLRPTGQWNYQQATIKGSRVTVELNGFTILDTDLAEINMFLADTPHPGKDRVRGHFGLAGHSDPVEFRKIEIKRLN